MPQWIRTALIALLALGSIASGARAQTDATTPRFVLELEAGATWQSRNDVEIPNDGTATRFSLVDLAGNGPWPAGRLYFTWNINEKHSLRALAAPLSYTETGAFDETVLFAGESYDPGVATDGTYKFNSWRLGYRYTFSRSDNWIWRVGFTAKVRDAKIALAQGSTSSEKTDLGFVPLLHLSGDWIVSERWRFLLDFEGLAGGPGRAFDVALKTGYALTPEVWLTAGYRTVEGGADVEAVYNFAWFHYAVISGVFLF